mgnify:CR=1 FL=1
MRSSIQQKGLEPAEQKAEKRRIRVTFVSPGTRKAALVITVVLPALLMAYAWFMNHRPPLHIKSEWTLQDTLIQNSDLFLSFVFLIVSALPFYLVFDRKKVKARELTPIALMAALCVVGRAAFSLIPLPNFKPVSAIIIITALAFGPEAGYLTGALAAILSNFLFGQGPWTPWQMVAMGLVGFLAGALFHSGLLRRTRGALCAFGALAAIFLYGALMSAQSALLWMQGLNVGILISYLLAGLPMDAVQAAATVVFLWCFSGPVLEKLERVKVKYGLME